MKKAIIILLVIVAACFLCANLNYLMSIIDAMQGGALIPLVIACIIMVARHVVQAMSYNEAFGAVGQKTGLWHNIVLIFSLVFINTFCLFSGATGVAFIIDDAHRKGLDIGTSTSGADPFSDRVFRGGLHHLDHRFHHDAHRRHDERGLLDRRAPSCWNLARAGELLLARASTSLVGS